jgi:hypothetical protein
VENDLAKRGGKRAKESPARTATAVNNPSLFDPSPTTEQRLVVASSSDFFKRVECVDLVDTDGEDDCKIAASANGPGYEAIVASANGPGYKAIVTHMNGPGYEAIVARANGPGYKAITVCANGPGNEAIIACELDRECCSANCMLGHTCRCSSQHKIMGPVFSAAAFSVDRSGGRMLSCREKSM